MDKRYWILENDQITPETLTVINDFLGGLKQANRSNITIYRYNFILKNFFLDHQNIGDLTADDVLLWINSHYGDKKPETIKKYLIALAVFFKYCRQEGYVNRILVKRCWWPRIPKPIPRYLDKNEQARVKLQADKLPLRDRAIYELFLSSGCRRFELAGISLKDINLAQRSAKVLGKGGKIRYVYFSDTCAILLQKYLQTHPKTNEALLLNKYGQRLSIQWIYKIISELGKKAQLSRRISPHCLRHTFATNLSAKGADLDIIANALGHQDLNTTRIYANLPDPEIVTLYRKYMG